MDIAVIGSSDFITGFKLAGIRKTYEAKDDLEAKIQSVLQDRTVGILVIHQDDLKRLPVHLQKILDDSVEPTVIAIGGGESTSLRDKIKQSVGVDLWK